MSFSVASYNVLADAYVRPERYPGVAPAVLAIGYRKPLLLERVAGLGADVICLQEVEPDVCTALDGRLRPLGYEVRYAQKGLGKPDGCATFVRGGVVAVRAQHTLHYADGPDPESHSGHVALVLLLEREGRSVAVANTHVKWDPPGTPLEEQLGYRQVTQLLQVRTALGPAYRTSIICGDFNVTPDNAIVRALTEAGLVDAYRDREHAGTYARDGAVKRIDYLFHTPDLESRPADLPRLDSRTLLPSPREPSDHLPIMAWFDWARP